MLDYDYFYNFIDHPLPYGFERICPVSVIGSTVERARELFNRALQPMVGVVSRQLSESSTDKSVLCLPDQTCFQVITTTLLEKAMPSGQTVAKMTTKVTLVEKSSLYTTLFGYAKQMIHHCSLEGKRVCESIHFTSGDAAAKQCTEGPFEGKLLSQVCTFIGNEAATVESAGYSLSNIIGGVVALTFLGKGIQAYFAGGKLHQAKALTWCVLSAASLYGAFSV
jgi:hypothetical protein